MAGPGWVTVSLRRSTTCVGTPARLPDPRAQRAQCRRAAARDRLESMAGAAPGPLPRLFPAGAARSGGSGGAGLPGLRPRLTRAGVGMGLGVQGVVVRPSGPRGMLGVVVQPSSRRAASGRGMRERKGSPRLPRRRRRPGKWLQSRRSCASSRGPAASRALCKCGRRKPPSSPSRASTVTTSFCTGGN